MNILHKEFLGIVLPTGKQRVEKEYNSKKGEFAMPILSMFYGIIIRMYFVDNKQHHVAHIHAEYAEEKAVFSIVDGAILAGKFTNSKARLVQAWIEIHRDELTADWQLAVNGEEVFKIEPLK